MSDLFDSLVVPVLLYSCEIWGFEEKAMIELFHIKFCKQIMKLNKNTAKFMASDELGRVRLKTVIELLV